jgi:hypothetical protein
VRVRTYECEKKLHPNRYFFHEGICGDSEERRTMTDRNPSVLVGEVAGK